MHSKIATTDFNIAPRVDYRTMVKVDGPLVILDNVKLPKYSLFFLLFVLRMIVVYERYAEIVNVYLGDGSIRKG